MLAERRFLQGSGTNDRMKLARYAFRVGFLLSVCTPVGFYRRPVDVGEADIDTPKIPTSFGLNLNLRRSQSRVSVSNVVSYVVPKPSHIILSSPPQHDPIAESCPGSWTV